MSGLGDTDAASDTCVVENLTPQVVHIDGRHGYRLRLPPLGRQEISCDAFDATFDEPSITTGGRVIVDRVPPAPQGRTWGVLIAIVAAIWLAAAMVGRWYAVIGALALTAVAVIVFKVASSDRTEMYRSLRQRLSLCLVLASGLGLPAVAIVYSTEVRGLLPLSWAAVGQPEVGPVLVARSVQWAFIALASLLPVLLYYLFDRVELGTLSDRFVRQVFRLNPVLETMGDVDARYGRQMTEVYGPSRVGGRRLSGGRRSPLVVASLLLTTGWTATLLNAEVVTAGDGVLRVGDLTALLRPSASVLTYAFLGAYVFSVELLVRGYIRGDLRPKTYTRAATRIVIAVVLAFVFELFVDDERWILLVAFTVGVFPDWALKTIIEQVRRVGDRSGKPLDGPSPLLGSPVTVLDEIGMYDKSALADEGIDNVEALAHCDLIDLMIQTRLPAAQVVDWVDQAILHLHTHHLPQIGAGDGRLWDELRRCGIRTASGLVAVVDADDAAPGESTSGPASTHRGAADPRTRARARRSLHDQLSLGLGVASPLDVLRSSIADEEWLPNILAWREQPTARRVLTIDAAPVASTDEAANEVASAPTVRSNDVSAAPASPSAGHVEVDLRAAEAEPGEVAHTGTTPSKSLPTVAPPG